MDPRFLVPQFAGVPDLDNETRRSRGRVHTSYVQIAWFDRNQWSHPIFADLADWALDENGAVHPSQISHIRNHKMRMFGLKVLDGFGAVNLAVWAFHNDPALLKAMRCRPLNGTIKEILERSTAILNPLTDAPMAQGDWMALFMGYLEVPGIPSGAVDPSDHDFMDAVGMLGPYVAAVIQSMGIDVWTAHSRVASAMQDPAKARRFMAVAAGCEVYDPKTLANDLDEICSSLEAIDGNHRSSSDLIADVLRHKTRSVAF